MIELTGITWDHARGYDPMIATSDAFSQLHPDVKISWKKRSLKEFGDYPIQKLAETFDLLVIDHPFVGFAAADGCLIPLDDHIESAYLDEQAANSVGRSHISYFYGGHQWALAIDAAGQISAFREDLLPRQDVPHTWESVLSLARALKAEGHAWVALPLVPIDAFMSLFSLCASLGEDPCSTPDYFVSREMGRQALDLLLELASVCHPRSLEWNPIAAFDAMADTDEIAYIPLLFGYSNYGRAGFRKKVVSFANIPSNGPVPYGGILGGTGLAISTRCQHIPQAVAYAQFTASRDVQKGIYVRSGGQPGHRAAWLDEAANALTNNFFRDTLDSLDNSYLRPRYNGYMHFQETVWYWVHDFLREPGNPDELLARIDDLYRETQQGN